MKHTIIPILILLTACVENYPESIVRVKSKTADSLIIQNRDIPLAKHFGFPLAYSDFDGYHDAKPFGSGHLGADFNGIEGGDSDLGDTIKSIGNGVVTISSGCLLNIMHRTTNSDFPVITSIYYHCDTLFVKENDIVNAGEPIALVGKKDTHVAHLHFEIAIDTNQVGGFYGNDTVGFINPILFIKNHR